MEEIGNMSDEELVAGIKVGNHQALKVLYKTHYPMVQSFVLNNSGSIDEAKDIYQETVIVFYEKVRSEGFELTSKIKTFLYAVSRRLWLKQLNVKGRKVGEVRDDVHYEVPAELDGMEEREQRLRLLKKSMDALGEPCKTILTDFFYRQLTMVEIAEKMGYTNAANAKNQKYKCFNRFKKLVIVNSRIDH